MKSAPLVSVILPTFNRALLLRRSILSVLAQTYDRFELIVVDDCSSDQTPDIVGGISDPRLRYVRRNQNGRAALARNDGIALAQGDLIAFQDDDDMWLPHKLERQVEVLMAAPQDVGLLLCSYLRWYPDRVRYIGHDYHFRRLDFARGAPHEIDYGLVATPGWLVRRAALERAGPFDARLRSWDDWELALRLWQTCRLDHLDEPLFIQDHVQGSAMMRDEAAFAKDMKVILEKHGALWEQRPAVQAGHYYLIGKGECLYGSVAEGRDWLYRSVSRYPLHLRAWITLLLSYAGGDGVGRVTRLSRALLGGPRAALRRLHQRFTAQSGG